MNNLKNQGVIITTLLVAVAFMAGLLVMNSTRSGSGLSTPNEVSSTYIVNRKETTLNAENVTILPVDQTVLNKKTKSIDLNRTVYIWGPVRNNNSAETAAQIRKLDNGVDPIFVVINSPGGDVLGGALVVSAIQEAVSPVYIICVQMCASMGFIIHQYGTERMMLDRAIIMSHQASYGVQGERGKIESFVQLIKIYIDRFDREIAMRAGLSVKAYNEMINNELWMDVVDAQKLGFNDFTLVIRGGGEDLLKGPPPSVGLNRKDCGCRDHQEDEYYDDYDYKVVPVVPNSPRTFDIKMSK